MKDVKVGSLFAGVGGICLGFLKALNPTARYSISFANEIDEYACETYRTNFSHPLLEGDINYILNPDKSDDVERYTDLHRKMFSEPIDVLNGGFPCLTGDTEIFTENGLKKIVDIVPGDRVMSHDCEWHKVLAFMDQGEKPVREMKVHGLGSIKATANHRFYVRRNLLGEDLHEYMVGKPHWVSVYDIFPGDFVGCPYVDETASYVKSHPSGRVLISDNYVWYPVVSIEEAGVEHVYDIEVEDSHSFIANGCVSHNCQAFSIAGAQRGFADERGNLFLSIIGVINQMDAYFHRKPRILFLENVKNLKSHDDGRTYSIIKQKLEDCGYIVKDAVLNTCDYTDVPQNRERIYIIGFLNQDDADRFTMFDHLDQYRKPLDVQKRIDIVRSIIDETVTDDRYFYTADKFPHYFEPENGPTKKTLRVNIAEEITEKYCFYQLRRGLYVRQNKNHVCPTLTANMGTGGHNVPLIFTDHGIRKLTPVECFKIQGFPIGDGYDLPVTYEGRPYGISHLYKQAGNAVSVPVITLMANELLKLFGEDECLMVDGKDIQRKRSKYRKRIPGKEMCHVQLNCDKDLVDKFRLDLIAKDISISEWFEDRIRDYYASQVEE